MKFLRRRRRDALKRQPFPVPWRQILRRNLAYYGRLPEADRHELEGHIHVFLNEKRFEGCDGLQLTDEMRVTIAGQACILLLHRDTDYFAGLETILVYPTAYWVRGPHPVAPGVVSEDPLVRQGESWQHGSVVLSWRDVLGAAHRPTSRGDLRPPRSAQPREPPRNLVLHEFAHQLDREDGAADGVPVLPKRSMYAEWSRVFTEEYEQLQRDEVAGRPTVIDPYGASDPAEFFAVVTEAFFEDGLALRTYHPALYALLRQFYNQDPASLA